MSVCFFFSSRRRHTRYIGDWSSDVCSSDLVPVTDLALAVLPAKVHFPAGPQVEEVDQPEPEVLGDASELDDLLHAVLRSEERRVGKECRTRGWAETYKRKGDGVARCRAR